MNWTTVDGESVSADPRWLRSTCRCVECGDSSAGLRWFSPSTLAAQGSTDVDRFTLDNGELHVVFGDGHVSAYDRAELEHRLRSFPEPSASGKVGDSLVDALLAAHDFESCMTNDDALFVAIDELVRLGITRFTGAPQEPSGTAEFAERFGPVRHTSYGPVQEFKTVANPRTAAETGRAQIPHTDEPYRYNPPGFLFFHSAVAGPEGQGSSLFVDGFAAAEELRRTNLDAFETLATVPVPVHRLHEDDVHFLTESRVITIGPDDTLEAIRLNTRCFADLDPTDSRTGEVLDALAALVAIIELPHQQRVLHLHAGDMVAFDNHRVMHGRTAFSDSTARHLLSCNVDRDAVHSTWRVLSAQRGHAAGRLPQGPST